MKKTCACTFFCFYYLPANRLTSEPSNLGSLTTTILTRPHPHLSRLRMPAAIRPNPNRTNQTQGGVYTITKRIPTRINRIDKKFVFLWGLWGLCGLRGLYRFHTNIDLHLPSRYHYVSILLHSIRKAWKGYYLF